MKYVWDHYLPSEVLSRAKSIRLTFICYRQLRTFENLPVEESFHLRKCLFNVAVSRKALLGRSFRSRRMLLFFFFSENL